jgi:hypothetical protein
MVVNRPHPKHASEALPEPSAEHAGPGEVLATQDVALLSGPSSDGEGVTILRSRQGRLEAGVVRPLRPGKPIQGEVVRLKPRKACPVLCDVETVMKSPLPRDEDSPSPVAAQVRSGPAQVASDVYRKNWDAIYRHGKKQQLLN